MRFKVLRLPFLVLVFGMSSIMESQASAQSWLCNEMSTGVLQVPQRFRDSAERYLGGYLMTQQLPQQRYLSTISPYDSELSRDLLQQASPLPGLVDACGASHVPLDFGGVTTFMHSRLHNVPNPYGGYGVYAPFDIRFISYSLGIAMLSGGMQVDNFRPNWNSNVRYTSQNYSTIGTGRFVVNEESFTGNPCSLTIRDDTGTVMEASCLSDWTNDAKSASDLPSVTAQILFLRRITYPDGRQVIYNYVPHQEYLDSIVTMTATSQLLTSVKFSYTGIHRDARLASVVTTDHILNTSKTTQLGYINGALTSIDSDGGRLELSYDAVGRLRTLFTASAKTIYPTGGIQFEYNNQEQVTVVRGPTTVGSTVSEVRLDYLKLSNSWRITAPQYTIQATSNITGLRSFIAIPWQFIQNGVAPTPPSNYDPNVMNYQRNLFGTRNYSITRWDDSGDGSYIDYLDSNSVLKTTRSEDPWSPGQALLAGSGQKNGSNTYVYNVRSGYPNSAQVGLSNHRNYIANISVDGPNFPLKTVYYATPIPNSDGKTYLDEFYTYQSLSGKAEVTSYFENGVLGCSYSTFAPASTQPKDLGRCPQIAVSSNGPGQKWVCTSSPTQVQAYGRCLESSLNLGGKDASGGSVAPYSVTIIPDPTYPWLDKLIQSPAGEVELTRSGNQLVTTVRQGGDTISQTTSTFSIYGPTSVTHKPWGSSESLTAQQSYASNGNPVSASSPTGDQWSFGQNQVLGLINSVGFKPITSQQNYGVSTAFNNLGIPTGVTSQAGQSSTTLANVTVNAWNHGIPAWAPQRPQDLCDPASTSAAKCDANSRFICTAKSQTLQAGEFGPAFTRWEYTKLDSCDYYEYFRGPFGGGVGGTVSNLNTGKCVMDYTIKGVALPEGATNTDPVHINMPYPTCVSFKMGMNLNNCCSYVGCTFSGPKSMNMGQNRWNGNYRCEYLVGLTTQPACKLTAGEYCAEPPPASHVPKDCPSVCPTR